MTTAADLLARIGASRNGREDADMPSGPVERNTDVGNARSFSTFAEGRLLYDSTLKMLGDRVQKNEGLQPRVTKLEEEQINNSRLFNYSAGMMAAATILFFVTASMVAILISDVR